MNITPTKLTQIINSATDRAADKAVKKYRPVWRKDLKMSIAEIKQQNKESLKELKRHNRALLGSFKESLRGITEIGKAKPNEERVSDIIKEETKETRYLLNLTVQEVGEINKKLGLTKNKSMVV